MMVTDKKREKDELTLEKKWQRWQKKHKEMMPFFSTLLTFKTQSVLEEERRNDV